MSKEERNYRPRFAFEITDEQQKRASDLFATHGQRRALMSVVLDDLLDLLEERGQIVAGLLMDNYVKPREVLPVLAQVANRTKR
jgi:hypothetical protein